MGLGLKSGVETHASHSRRVTLAIFCDVKFARMCVYVFCLEAIHMCLWYTL